MNGRILIVDDEPHILKTMTIGLRAAGYEVTAFEEAELALKEADRDIFGEKPFDLAFIDLMMFPMNGIVLMQELKRRQPDLTVVIITAHGTVETAVSAMKQGAFDYLQKPFELRELTQFADRVMQSHRIQLRSQAEHEIITENPVYLGVLRMAERVAPSQLTVLIEGETGTGKELVANFIHARSDRASKPLVKVNCAALSSELIESELFGHVKGSFTGALRDRQGRVEAADGGTLFLDEVGEMPIAMQAKLLRFLQSREYQRVGENETRHADVRIIAATNRNLEESIERGVIREDLFYRLSGVRLLIPPLRIRKEDILPLAERFLSDAVRSSSTEAMLPHLSEAVQTALLEYDWRGNVRELEHAMLRAAILAGPRGTIELQDLPTHIARQDRADGFSNLVGEQLGVSDSLKSLEEVERDHIARVIARTASLEEAARVLKIDSATLWRKRKKYAL
ncbi:MAG: sigma-54 dependent transcriptional regulator [Bacteroidota bacterium]|nr:sigma-54 dependent transcriptional regulator [Bacteroidota bacterium]MDP4232347.1 sigma-54 dependent transcriptional regulator [Bacteroidota bacterium]MDP4241486.1 sigma-54 dependent transcriptional regulator [Bacteroidota bacterium]